MEEDYPHWDSEDIPHDILLQVLKLEETGVIDGYYDLSEHTYTHEVGGYPSFCQSGIDFGENNHFTFQISSDDKIHLNIVDSGSFMYAKYSKTGAWTMYYDFY